MIITMYGNVHNAGLKAAFLLQIYDHQETINQEIDIAILRND